jgi:hypothetical protein
MPGTASARLGTPRHNTTTSTLPASARADSPAARRTAAAAAESVANRRKVEDLLAAVLGAVQRGRGDLDAALTDRVSRDERLSYGVTSVVRQRAPKLSN